MLRLLKIIVATNLAMVSGCLHSSGSDGFASPQLPETTDTKSLHARFFGVSTLLFADAEDGILIDAFFSRPSLAHIFTGFSSDKQRIVAALQNVRLNVVSRIFVAHTHHDHALDSANVAHMIGARLYGSENTKKIARNDGLSQDLICVIKQTDRIETRRFRVTIYETGHAPAPLLLRAIEGLTFLPGVGQFRFDKNFSFYIQHPQANILVVTSAALPQGGFGNINADIVFLSIGYLNRQTREQITRYWHECVVKTGAKLVVPIHWDNLTGPVEKGLRPPPRFVDDIRAVLQVLKTFETTEVRIEFMPVSCPVAVCTSLLKAQ